MKVFVASTTASVLDAVAGARCGDEVISVAGEPDLHRVERHIRSNGQDIDAILLHVPDTDSPDFKTAMAIIARLDAAPVCVILPRRASTGQVRRCYVMGAAATLCEEDLPETVGHILCLMTTGAHVAVFGDGLIQPPPTDLGKLSERELQVLEGICRGHQNKEIAHGFEIKEVTVKMHVRAIIRKLNAKNRTHAAMIARDLGLVG
ncbi:response regulator transcription factor [Maritimibacter sp. UBA3975]|uniref:helix-turn-helix transcriptional regulator n=1 Tax=Maritimibacter sp. UBA3975 TaxID=1946833 RepID=UPI0025C64058|nr:response regulator transcription factor [Maritimibacter sp. UBA3975]